MIMSDKKPTIRIHFADQWKGYPASNNEVITILSKEYEIVFDTESPDILFYSSFGWEHIYYNDPLKVFWSPENVYPDFNDCNYALSHLRDRISGRNIWYPYWLKAIEPSFWYQSWLGEQNPEDIEQLFPLPKDPEKRPFASFIASSSELYGARYREEFVKYLMEKYKHVDCPGKILHNIEIPELEPRDGSWLPSKRSYIGRYKFNIAFENSNTDGYITEKLADCFMANTVPIYWGSEGNIDPFPREAVICANDYTDFDSLLARIKEVDENDDLYLAMLRANPVHRAEFMSEVQKHCDEVRKFIRYIAQEALNRKKSDGCYRRRSVGNADNIVCYIVKKERNRIIKATIFNFIKLPAKMIKSYIKKLFYVFSHSSN